MSSTLVIRDVHLAYDDAQNARKVFDVVLQDGRVARILDASEREHHGQEDNGAVKIIDVEGKGLLIPSLCHAHIHLDKCFLLDRCELVKGDFSEALEVTSRAKAAFSSDTADMYARGQRLIVESVAAGVTRMRAHVEVDTIVQNACLDAALRLKHDYKNCCDVEISLFAQDPLFPSPSSLQPGDNYTLLEKAATSQHISSIGSAPYVEPTASQAKSNIRLILDLAHAHSLHADFHLDYTLDASSEPLIWFLLSDLRARVRTGRWHAGARVCVGHATRLTLFSPAEWSRYAHEVAEDRLPVTLAGLPQSDVYMMGRALAPVPRSTLDVVRLARAHGVGAALAVNNVANAFTPQGPPDPLALCPLGVALFQAGTKAACAALLRSVTTIARVATGNASPSSLFPQVGDVADFVVLHDNPSVQDAACNPCYDRTTIKNGRVVARRRGHVELHPH
ncbi:cytosine deaminase-like protein [Phanerochaete sordida]|uniref:Cytosine deaminase-like protein n=1 Tax=Phanerochaete sordida TaxID=48140 RepID=A0A9P3GQ36_9APHY|nr:cytosine deaminase-like protein [Phanerochaete sordida]